MVFSSRWCGHLAQPEDGGGECDDGAVVSSGFLVAGSDAAELLEPGEAAFDEMALLVELPVERVLGGSRGVVGDHRLGIHGGDDCPEVVGVIGGVSQHDLGLVPADQAGSLRHVASVTAGQVEGDRTAKPTHGQVDLGAQASSRAAKRLIFSPFFAPAAC